MAFTTRSTVRRLLSLVLALLMLLPAIPALATNVNDSLAICIQCKKTATVTPLNPKDRDMVSVFAMVYEGLIAIDDNYMPQPNLCESWERTGSKKWTFHLRTDVRFSDGTEMTAKDVVATIDAILKHATDEAAADKGYYQNLSYFVAKAKADNDHTVIITTKPGRDYYGLLFAMTFPILKESEVNRDDPLGTGPYMITAFEPFNTMLLEANPNWWQQQPQVKRIAITMKPEAAGVIEEYQYARADMIFSRSISASMYSTGSNTLVLNTRTAQLETLLINNNSFPLDDPNIRRAIRLAINPDKLASACYNGMVTRTDTPMIPGTWTYNDNLTAYFRHDTAEAIRLLEAANWYDTGDDGVRVQPKADGSGNYRLHIRLLVYEEPDNNVRVQAANMIADWLNAIGFQVAVTTVTMADMQDRLNAGSFDLALVAFQMDPVPDPGFLLMSRNSGDYSRYRNSAMTEMFNKESSGLRYRHNQSEYQQVLMDIQLRYAQDLPFICLYYRRGVILTRRMFTSRRDVRELDLLRGIEAFRTREK